jgi:DNA-binding beta-propeller fold protein YncE
LINIQKNKANNHQNSYPFCNLFILTVGVFLSAFFAKHAVADEVRHIQVEHLRDISGDFNQPTEIAVSDTGHIFILDGANDHVVVFNQDGKMLYQFGKQGEQAGEIKDAVGLCLDHNQNVYVADTGNQRIGIFDTLGNYIRKIDLTSWAARPVNVKVAEKTGRIYVSDAQNHKILCFNLDGVFKFAWGSYGKNFGEFKFPGMSCIDDSGNLLVVDILNGRIQIFNPDGKNPRQLSTLGILPGQLFRPKGIVIDDQSRIFVSDSYTGIIQIFNPDGSLYGILSLGPSEFLRLTTPLGMAFDKKGRFYVVQSTMNIISVYNIIEKK